LLALCIRIQSASGSANISATATGEVKTVLANSGAAEISASAEAVAQFTVNVASSVTVALETTLTAEKLGEAWTDFAAGDETWSDLAASNIAFSNISANAGDWLNQ